MNLTNEISVLELIWTISSFIACIFGLRALIRAAFDLFYLERINKDHLRRYVAVSSVISFVVWTLVPTVYLYIGSVAMTIPQPPGRMPIRSVINLSLFIGASVVLAVGAFVIDYRRKKIVQMIEKGERK